MEGLVVLSLFGGMECGRIALDELGIPVEKYLSSETNPWSIAVAEDNYDDIIQVGDITKLSYEGGFLWRNGVAIYEGRIDLVIGGSPCQSLSRMGDGTGLDGKSKLFYDWVRIRNQVVSENPNCKWLLENVVMKKEWKDLMSEFVGCEPVMVDSRIVSVQKRQRLYWTNIEGYIIDSRDSGIHTSDIIDEEDSWVELPEDFLWYEDGEYRVRNATKQGYLVVNNFDSINLDFPNSKTRRGRVGKGKINTLNTGCNQGVFIAGKVKRLTVRECERAQNVPDGYTKVAPERKAKEMLGNGWTVGVIKKFFKALK